MNRFPIVDDQEACRELLLEMIESLAECDCAKGGEEAVQAFQRAAAERRPYDLVCLDILMPDMNGHEVLRRIRQLENEAGVYGSERAKVIMTTALADAQNNLQAFRSGCEAYVVKPFSEHEMLAAMRRLGLLETAAV